MKILVVEDETKTGNYLKQGLTEAGFVVDLVRDGNDGLHAAVSESYDLVVLDIMLPGIDGWTVLRGLRERGATLPVLFLTARDQVDDRVRGLESGADDYLVKPFDLDELLARIVAVQRRVAPPAQVSVQGVALDLAGHRARRGDESIDLTAMEWAVLECLASRTGRICSRDAIVDALVGQGLVGGDSNSLEVIVSRLRKKLGAAAISTHRGLGYRLDA